MVWELMAHLPLFFEAQTLVILRKLKLKQTDYIPVQNEEGRDKTRASATTCSS
jgi:hypothetical protein